MMQSTVLCAEITCNELIKEIYQLYYPLDDYNQLQPLAKFIDDKQIDCKVLEGITEVLQEYGIINVYNEFTEWSQNNGVGMVVNYDGELSGYKNLFLKEVHLITKQGKMLIERLCPELQQLNQPLTCETNVRFRNSLFLQPSMKLCYN